MDEVAPHWFGGLAQLREELSSDYRSDAPFFNLDRIDTNLPLFETFLTFKLRIMNEVLEAKSKEELLSISRSISIWLSKLMPQIFQLGKQAYVT